MLGQTTPDDFQLHVDLNYISDPNANIIYSPIKGGLYKGSYSTVTLTWTAQTDGKLEGYNVYWGVTPLIKIKANKTAIVTEATYTFELPLYPQNIINYFWVGKVVNGVETILNPEGTSSYYMAEQENVYGDNPITPNYAFPETDNVNDAIKQAWDQGKQNKKFILETLGVKCDVYLRRWGAQYPHGVICSCVEDKEDPDFHGSGRCAMCFGTGLVGGYYEPFEAYILFPNKVASNFKGQVYGLTLIQTYDAWTITPPFIRSEDLIVRKVDGRRYKVNDVSVMFFRGAASIQAFQLELLSPADIRHVVSTSTINAALAKIDDPRFNPNNRNSI